PPLALVEKTLITTAKDDFAGSEDAYESAVAWHREKLEAAAAAAAAAQGRSNDTAAVAIPCPFIACGTYSTARETLSHLQEAFPRRSIRRLHLGKEHGACLMLTMASMEAAAAVSEDLPGYGLLTFAPFPATLKLAPGLLDHGSGSEPAIESSDDDGTSRLTTTHGKNMREGQVLGLNLQLSPGVLPAHHHEAAAGLFIGELLKGLMVESLDLHETNFWSAPANTKPASSSSGALREEWRRAAEVVHGLSGKKGGGGGCEVGRSPGDICGWEHVSVHHAGDDILFLTGIYVLHYE
ncbi:unnamed protein product, partial [Laminaria digitata]